MHRYAGPLVTVLMCGISAPARAENSFLEWERTPRELAIEAAMASPARFSFVKQPLDKVVQYLEQEYQIEFEIDNSALADKGTRTDEPVTINVTDMTLRSALQTMLRPLDLTWMFRNEAVLITTGSRADEMLETKLYDVSDLVLDTRSSGQNWPDYDSLIETIVALISPDSWDENGGAGATQKFDTRNIQVLAISQTLPVHAQIADLLSKLRNLSPPRVLPGRARPSLRLGGPNAAAERPGTRLTAHAPRTRQRSYVSAPAWMVPRVHE